MADDIDIMFVDVILEEFLVIENVEFFPTIKKSEEEVQKQLINISQSELMSIINSLKSTNPTLIFDCHNTDELNNELSDELLNFVITSSPQQESNAEKSWKLFHSSLDSIVEKIQKKNQIERNSLIFLLLKYFEKLVHINIFFQTQSQSQQDSVKGIDSDERDIIAYIGGSIVGKLLKKCHKNANLVSVLSRLKSTTECTDTNMIKLLDRGGLTYINEKAIDFFVLLELCFREINSDSVAQKISKPEFITKCRSNVAITKNFWDAVIIESSTEKYVEESMILCLDGFFIIRAHHKCRKMMQAYLKETKCKKSKPGSKGLRTELKNTFKLLD